MIGGLIFLGFALQGLISWIGTAVAWAIYVFGALTATVAVLAYSLDVFPKQAAEAGAWVNLFRTVGGFIVNYFRMSPDLLSISLCLDFFLCSFLPLKSIVCHAFAVSVLMLCRIAMGTCRWSQG
jgi:hypothetical protein